MVEVTVVDVSVTVEEVCGQVWHIKGHNSENHAPINRCVQ